MPTLTNKFNLPAPLVKAVENDPYTPGRSDYTTTQLAGVPARQLVLRRRHREQILEDVADRIYSLSGQSKHVVLERAAQFCEEYEYLAEERFYIERDGKTIGGQIDLYDKKEKILWDWKEVSVWVSDKDLKPEWINQANINALLMAENGYEVKQVSNIALYRDWKKAQVGTREGYPPHQVQQFPIPLWTREETEAFISHRIAEFESAKTDLPICTREERWQSDDVYALVKTGNKKATKLFKTPEDTQSHREIFNLIKGYEVQFREGISKRCLSYCDVSTFCDFWQNNKPKENENGSE